MSGRDDWADWCPVCGERVIDGEWVPYCSEACAIDARSRDELDDRAPIFAADEDDQRARRFPSPTHSSTRSRTASPPASRSTPRRRRG